MGQYVSMPLVELPHMFMSNKFEDSIPFGYFETEINGTVFVQSNPDIQDTGLCITTFSISFTHICMGELLRGLPLWLVRN